MCYHSSRYSSRQQSKTICPLHSAGQSYAGQVEASQFAEVKFSDFTCLQERERERHSQHLTAQSLENKSHQGTEKTSTDKAAVFNLTISLAAFLAIVILAVFGFSSY